MVTIFSKVDMNCSSVCFLVCGPCWGCWQILYISWITIYKMTEPLLSAPGPDLAQSPHSLLVSKTHPVFIANHLKQKLKIKSQAEVTIQKCGHLGGRLTEGMSTWRAGSKSYHNTTHTHSHKAFWFISNLMRSLKKSPAADQAIHLIWWTGELSGTLFLQVENFPNSDGSANDISFI